jgi:hypothetical protein
MSRLHAAVAAAVALGLGVVSLAASGQAGIYGVIERVVLEPAAGPAERIQVFGAFALIERMPAGYRSAQTSDVAAQVFTNYMYRRPARGFLYFRLPQSNADTETVRREWKDLASVAGTKQAVAFGYWDTYRGDTYARIRESASPPTDPDIYYTDIGVVKLGTTGNHAGIVAELLKLVGSAPPARVPAP